MKNLVCTGIAVILLTACSMRSPQSAYQITERSKREVPPWVALEPNQFHEDNGRYSLVAFREHILDLPLGIRQTEEAAYSACETALHALVRAELLPSRPSFSAASRQDLDQRIMKAVRKHYRDLAKIDDIYYEKNAAAEVHDVIAGGSYRVYVLLRFSSDRMAPLLKELSASLRRSPHGEVASLSSLVTSRKK